MGRLSRDKGARWEREVARRLRPIFGAGVKRGLAQSRFGRSEAPDVDGCGPLWVECKHGRRVNLRAALRQAVDAMAAARRRGDRWPVAVCRDNGEAPVVLLRLDHFLGLLAEWRLAPAEVDGATGPSPATNRPPQPQTARPAGTEQK